MTDKQARDILFSLIPAAEGNTQEALRHAVDVMDRQARILAYLDRIGMEFHEAEEKENAGFCR